MKRFRVGDQVYCDAFGDGEVYSVYFNQSFGVQFGGDLITFATDGRVISLGHVGNAPIPIFFRHSGRRDNLEREITPVVGGRYVAKNGPFDTWEPVTYRGELDGQHWYEIVKPNCRTLTLFKHVKEGSL